MGLDLTLEVGQTTQTIEVTAAPPMVEKETTNLATTINPKTYLDLPLSAGGGRSPITFMSLAPGNYTSSSWTQSANGGQVWGRQLRVDGMDVGNVLSQPGDDSKTMTLPPDALQEFTFVTGDPPASARFRNLGVAKYSSLRRKVSELPTSATSGIGSLAYRFSVISVPSRVVVDGS